MVILKKIGIILTVIIALLVVLLLLATGLVDETPYFEAEYFKTS